MMLVTVIMPVYNAEKYLKQAVESVVRQTHQTWELIIINDGSTDGSDQIAQSFSDSRIKYFKQENKGVSAARNLGLQNMRGDFFCFLDADDQFPPNSLSSRLDIFKRDRTIEFVDGKVVSIERVKKLHHPTFKGNPRHDLLSLSGRSFFGPTWMVRNTGKVYRFQEQLTHGEDLLFYISISLSGKYSYTKDLVYKYRTENLSAMSDLAGLEAGYSQIYDILQMNNSIDKSHLRRFKSRTRSIMIKSYLSNLNFYSAVRAAIK